jgi:hypothetical protein
MANVPDTVNSLEASLVLIALKSEIIVVLVYLLEVVILPCLDHSD